MSFPTWYEQTDDGTGLVLDAVVHLPSPFGDVILRDPTERARRKAQEAARDILAGVSLEEARTGKVAASSVDLGKLANLAVAKLSAYVAKWDHLQVAAPSDQGAWSKIVDEVPSKVVDRIVLGIDYFTGAVQPDTSETRAEGNGAGASRSLVSRRPTSCSDPRHQPIADGSGLSSTLFTQAEPGSSPSLEVCAISPQGSRRLTESSS